MAFSQENLFFLNHARIDANLMPYLRLEMVLAVNLQTLY